MSEYAGKGELEAVVGDILGEKYMRSLVLIVLAVSLPIIISDAVFGNMSIRSLTWLGAGTIILSAILIYANLRLSPSKEAAEDLWGLVFVSCFGLGGLSLVLALSIYLPALISFTALWSILAGALLAGGVSAVVDNLD